ncbi:MAG: hypothetical protein PHE54_01170 [Bacilli bacterium]|nr:hypothetical protein [Bacilli bacterium]
MNLKYEQPNMKEIVDEYQLLLNKFSLSDEVSQLEIIKRINQIRDYFFSMYWLSYINYLLNVNNKYWNEQEAFFVKNSLIIDNLKLKYYKALNNYVYKEKLKEVIW